MICYALYKGDQFLDVGTKEELAARFNLKASTIVWLSTSKRQKIKDAEGKNVLIAVKFEIGEDE